MLQGLSHCVTSLAHLLALQTVKEMLRREMITQLAGVMPCHSDGISTPETSVLMGQQTDLRPDGVEGRHSRIRQQILLCTVAHCLGERHS